VWDRITLRQFLGKDDISDLEDKNFVKGVFKKDSTAIQDLFARWRGTVAENYYRLDHPSETSGEKVCIGNGTQEQFYLNYLVAPIRDHWARA
jgi:hypothetical protein